MRVRCQNELRDPFRCPTKWDYFWATMASIPRGRLWNATQDSLLYDFAPRRQAIAGRMQAGNMNAGQVYSWPLLLIMQSYWMAWSELLEHFSERACQLLLEFFCFSASETLDWWFIDYGFPDECDPWDSLCAKVAAQGGSTCEYITWAAGTRGWTIECSDCDTISSPRVGVGCSQMGCSQLCGGWCQANVFYVIIHLDRSPAYIAPANSPQMGCGQMGCTTLCDTALEHVECLIERVKPAHTEAIYILYLDGEPFDPQTA